MKTTYPLSIILALSFTILSFGKHNNSNTRENISLNKSYLNNNSDTKVDSEVLTDFFKRYSDLKKYQNEVSSLYKTRSYESIWYEGDKINEFGKTLYDKLNDTYEEKCR